MIFIHVDKASNNVGLIDKYIREGKQLFIIFYLEGCGPCNATRPEWAKLKNVLKSSGMDINDVKYLCEKYGYDDFGGLSKYILKGAVTLTEFQIKQVKEIVIDNAVLG